MTWISRARMRIDPSVLSATEDMLEGLKRRIETEPGYHAIFNYEIMRLIGSLYRPNGGRDIVWFLGFRDMVEHRAAANSLDALANKLEGLGTERAATGLGCVAAVMVAYLKVYKMTDGQDATLAGRALQIINDINALLMDALDGSPDVLPGKPGELGRSIDHGYAATR